MTARLIDGDVLEHRRIWRWERNKYLAAGWTVWGTGWLTYEAVRYMYRKPS